jgi:Ca-activated chloride channel family protein
MHEEIVDLGLTYDVVTPYTSFLAVPEKELNEAARDAVSSVRERRAKLLAANKDAAALSRLNMPPGDPILRVAAPRDAQRVTAYFPFGLVQDLYWDEGTEQWMTRFLVPKNVPDGVYDVKVAVTHADGHVEASITQYTIDAREPAFEVLVEPRAGGAFVRVLVDEPAKEVRVAEAVHPETAVSLAPSADGLTFTGFVQLAGGTHALRVVVADRARNESDRLMTVQVTP